MTNTNNKENIEKLELAINRLDANENVVYFLTYDTKSNPRAWSCARMKNLK